MYRHHETKGTARDGNWGRDTLRVSIPHDFLVLVSGSLLSLNFSSHGYSTLNCIDLMASSSLVSTNSSANPVPRRFLSFTEPEFFQQLLPEMWSLVLEEGTIHDWKKCDPLLALDPFDFKCSFSSFNLPPFFI